MPDAPHSSPQRRLWRIVTCVALLLAAVSILWSVLLYGHQNDASTANCLRIHTLTATLDKMIADGRKSLDAYLADGSISQAQWSREMARIVIQRTELAGADCPPRKAHDG